MVDSIRACVENNPNIAEAAEKLIADIERAFPAAEQKKISLISVEQNGETHDFLNSRNDSLYEIMTAAARKDNLKDYNSIGTRIDGIQYAELRGSPKLTEPAIIQESTVIILPISETLFRK